MRFEIRAMSVSEILDTGFQLLRSRFRLLATVGCAIYLPFAGFEIFAQDLAAETDVVIAEDETVAAAVVIAGVVSFAALMLGYPLIIATITRLIGEIYLGRDPTIGAGLRAGLERFLPVLGTSILITLVGGAAATVLVIGIASLASVVSSQVGPGASMAVATIASFGAIVAMFPLMAAWAVILQVVVFERTSGVAAIRRALDLTHGMRLRTFSVIFVAGLVQTILVVAVEFGVGAVPVVGALAGWAAQAIGFAYYSAAEVVLYFDLRCRKEAFDLEYLAQVVEAR